MHNNEFATSTVLTLCTVLYRVASAHNRNLKQLITRVATVD